ncbi:MAG TPA: hypothetical protein VI589_12940 [Vicinamibacteria bacterium]
MVESRAARASLAVFALVSWAGPVRAQDSHYWNLQYGPVAELLGGVVVGSAQDLSATYYDPGGLALATDPAFLLSLNTFQLEEVSLESVSERRSVSSSRFGSAPALIAGKLPDGWLGSTRMAWSFLTRQDFEASLSQKRAETLAGPPPARVGSEILIDQDLTESWGGLTWSRRVGERSALGITLYGVHRGQHYRTEFSGQAATEAGDGFALLTTNDYEFNHFRGLAKIGYALDRSSWSAGVTLTTPSLALFGSGQAAFTRSVSGLPQPGGGEAVLRNGFEDDLDSRYASPWAVAAGGAWKRGPSRYTVSVEWFAPVDRFAVLDTTAFVGQPGAESLVAGLTQQQDSVLNGGLGFEHEFDRDLSVYAAFATDFSSSVRSPEVNNGVATWNIYHLTGGAAFAISSVRFTAGLAFSFGGDERELAPPGVEEPLPILGGPEAAQLRYRRLKFILGFAFGR